MKLSVELARGIIDGYETNWDIIEDFIIENDRWSILHRAILYYGETGEYYETLYRVGATEYQEERPYEGEEEVTFVEVEPQETTITKYIRK